MIWFDLMKKAVDIIVFEEYLYMIIAYHHNIIFHYNKVYLLIK